MLRIEVWDPAHDVRLRLCPRLTVRSSVRISLCRLVITVIGCIIKIVLIPFKYVIGGGRPSGGHCEFSMQYFVSLCR